MTTVLAYARHEHTIMAADSMTNVYDRPVDGARKVIRCTTKTRDGEYLLGFAGEGAGSSVVQMHHTVDSLPNLEDEADRNGWASAVAQAITEIYAEHLLLDQGRMDAKLLLATGGHLWTVVHQQAIPHLDGMGAIGSGEGPALGALHAYLDSGIEPGLAVARACAIGVRLDRYSGGTPQVVSLDA